MGRGVRGVFSRLVNVGETIHHGRAVMHASVSMEYECDVNSSYVRLLIAVLL